MRILLIEDDKKLSAAIARQLEKQGYQIDLCDSGENALFYTNETVYDVIILDRMLPVLDGLSILEIIRKKGILTPVIMTTALDGISDRIDGLDAGADDYLTKPFAIEELSARIRALCRRPKAIQKEKLLQFSNLTLDSKNKLLSTPEKSCCLSKKETELLEFFIQNKGQTLEREQILSRVWGPDTFATNGNLDNYISFLRRRLKLVNSSCRITTIHGIGYRLEEN